MDAAPVSTQLWQLVKLVSIEPRQLEGLPPRRIFAGRPAFAGLEPLADKFQDSVLDGAAVDELGLGAVVIVSDGNDESDLIAENGAPSNGEVKLVPEHFAGDGVAAGFQTEGKVFHFAVAARQLPDPDAVDIGGVNGTCDEQETDYDL